MKGIVFLFDGQGAFKPGVGRDLYATYPRAQEVINQASEVLGYDLKAHLWGEAAGQTSGQTSIAQPAIAAVSLAYAAVLKDLGVTAEISLGHSLGEATAIVHSGCLGLADGIQMIKTRGALMEQGGKQGGMMAVVNVDQSVLEAECARIAAESGQPLVVANINAPGQVVVSGAKDALKLLPPFVSKNHGRSIPLDVGGAWHSPYLSAAADEFGRFLDTLEFHPPQTRFYSVVEQRPLERGEEIRGAFKRQMLGQVHWVQAIKNLKAMGYERFLEIGPSKILKDLVVKIAADVKIDTVAVYTDLKALAQTFTS